MLGPRPPNQRPIDIEKNEGPCGARTHACRVDTRVDASPGLRKSVNLTTISSVETHRRRLPHVYPENTPLFVTWSLQGSVPPNLFPPRKLTAGQAFVWLDRRLDTREKGRSISSNPKSPNW